MKCQVKYIKISITIRTFDMRYFNKVFKYFLVLTQIHAIYLLFVKPLQLLDSLVVTCRWMQIAISTKINSLVSCKVRVAIRFRCAKGSPVAVTLPELCLMYKSTVMKQWTENVDCETVTKLRRLNRNRRRCKLSYGVIFPHDNVSPQAASVGEKIQHFHCKLFDHSPYSPDLAYNNYFHVFYSKQWLGCWETKRNSRLILSTEFTQICWSWNNIRQIWFIYHNFFFYCLQNNFLNYERIFPVKQVLSKVSGICTGFPNSGYFNKRIMFYGLLILKCLYRITSQTFSKVLISIMEWAQSMGRIINISLSLKEKWLSKYFCEYIPKPIAQFDLQSILWREYGDCYINFLFIGVSSLSFLSRFYCLPPALLKPA